MNLIDRAKELAELESKATPCSWQPEESTVNENQAGIFHGNDISKEFILRYMHDAWGLREKDLNLIIALRNAAPAMLAVLGCFQPGDAATLDPLIEEERLSILECFGERTEVLDLFERLQKAASLMEAEG